MYIHVRMCKFNISSACYYMKHSANSQQTLNIILNSILNTLSLGLQKWNVQVHSRTLLYSVVLDSN